MKPTIVTQARKDLGFWVQSVGLGITYEADNSDASHLEDAHGEELDNGAGRVPEVQGLGIRV